MNKLRKSTLAAAISVAIGGTATVQAGAPQDSPIEKLLFPIISTAPGTFTFVSLVNDNFGSTEDHRSVRYKFTYMHKPWNAPQLEGCIHQDFLVTVSENFLLQFEVGGRAPIPDERFAPAAPDTVDPLDLNKNAFLVVELIDEDINQPPGPNDNFFEFFQDDVHLFGEAVIINVDNDLRWAYSTTFLGLEDDEGGSDEFSTQSDDFGELEGDEKNTSWYPEDVVRTIWHVLPLGETGEPFDSDADPDMLDQPGILMTVVPETSDLDLEGKGAFGRNENYFSGVLEKEIRCFGFFERKDVLTSSGLRDGGWMSLAGYKGNADNPHNNEIIVEVGEDPLDPDDPEGLTRGQSFLLHKIQYHLPIDVGPDAVLGKIDTLGVRHMVISREPERFVDLDDN